MPMKKSVAAESPDAYVAALGGWQGRYAQALRAAVVATAPLQEVVKWGHLVYSSNGPVLLIRAEERRVLFGFWRGQRLRGIEPRLKPGGKFEMATLELVHETPLDRSTVVALVKAAVALNGSLGDPTRSPRDPLPRPADRVVLRRLRPADLPAFQAYRGDPVVGRYQGWTAQTDREALAFIETMSRPPLFPRGSWLQLAIADRKGDGLAGDIGICVAGDGSAAELGITLSPGLQGRGLATEALGEAVALVFEHSPAGQVVCVADARNDACLRLLERAGMRRVASTEALFKGEPCTEHTYVLFRPAAG